MQHNVALEPKTLYTIEWQAYIVSGGRKGNDIRAFAVSQILDNNVKRPYRLFGTRIVMSHIVIAHVGSYGPYN